MNKSCGEMNDQQADIKNIIGKAFYTKLESKMSFDMLIVGHVVYTSETENLSSAMNLTFPNGCQPLTHGKMTSRAYC